MDRFQLATIADWAGEKGLQGRKRIQKVVYLLQRAGCPLGADFTLHLFGPYSRDVADACDNMVAAKLFAARVEPSGAGNKYCYQLTDLARKALPQTRQRFPDRAAELAQFRERAQRLLQEDSWQLELGATILYFQESLGDWNMALQEACKFKKVRSEDAVSESALQLAREMVPGDNSTRKGA
ncbi:MAG: hypothetical protein H6818_05330 [Phycisphaerales bacterium]|nr:hypothetical protein [Phycisphaerales bacterium]MCB9863393.1 hypothetical protein [Phycisphaerales bacterium]